MYGTQVAWCREESDLPETRQKTHDALIEDMGDRRRGGVQWRQYTGKDAVDALAQMTVDADMVAADYYRRIGAHLREYGGWLVLALAAGDPG